MAAGLGGQAGDNVRDLAGRDYRHESDPVQTRHPAMGERNVRELPNSIRIVCLNDAQVNQGKAIHEEVRSLEVRLLAVVPCLSKEL